MPIKYSQGNASCCVIDDMFHIIILFLNQTFAICQSRMDQLDMDALHPASSYFKGVLQGIRSILPTFSSLFAFSLLFSPLFSFPFPSPFSVFLPRPLLLLLFVSFLFFLFGFYFFVAFVSLFHIHRNTPLQHLLP